MKLNGMKLGWMLAAVMVLMVGLAGCEPGRSESEWTLENGYDAYFSAVDDAEGFQDLETCSITKAGFEEALGAAAKGVSKEALEDGDADDEDIANMEKAIKAFADEYDEFVDSEDYEPSTLDEAFVDNATSNLDFQSGVHSAMADLQVYLDENGPFVKFADANEWVSDYMDDLGSYDYYDEVVAEALKDKAAEMEGCWINVYDAKQEQ